MPIVRDKRASAYQMAHCARLEHGSSGARHRPAATSQAPSCTPNHCEHRNFL
ncbi:hypothetical protein IG631_01538 [Alternaria alternata]|nr:hypothetical protein IG631_01538 [Alternaria alternata]